MFCASKVLYIIIILVHNLHSDNLKSLLTAFLISDKKCYEVKMMNNVCDIVFVIFRS